MKKDITFKKHNIGDHHYYLGEYKNYIILINSESYHAPLEKFLNKRFCYYIYKKRNNRNVKDYVNSYDYETYDVVETFKKCKERSEITLKDFYLKEI